MRRAALGLLLVLVLLVAGVGGLLWATLPGGGGGSIPGLAAAVAIDLDRDGVPRIRAANELDAAAALGWLHARDRMFEMDLTRRSASGTLSELAGGVTLPIDRLVRTLGLRQAGEAELAGLDPDARAVLDAYARGVNARIAQRGRLIAPEFLPFGAPAAWTPLDSLLWGKTMAMYLSGNWRAELARLALADRHTRAEIEALWPAAPGGDHPEAAVTPALAASARRLAAALPAFPDPFTLPQTASNAWAVDGRFSRHHAPLLAGDPHLAFGLPGFWYLARIETPGGVLAGATAPGLPFLVLGHNGHIAWSITTTGADTQDLFVETPAGDGYATPTGPQPFVTRSETIHVRGGADETLTVRSTWHGPLVSDIVAKAGPMLALAAGGLRADDAAAAGLLALNRAHTIEDAGAAVARITAPVQNLTVADRDRIGLYVMGRVPIRAAGEGRFPEPGADGAHDWTGWASGAELPRVVAPAGGRVVNANERIAPDDARPLIGHDGFGDWRARRIRERLDLDHPRDAAAMAAIQLDTHSTWARDLLPTLLRVAPADARSGRALQLLARWDGNVDRDAPQPLILNAWLRRFVAYVLAARGIAEPGAAAAPWPDLAAHALLVDASYCGPAGCSKQLTDSLAASMAELAKTNGDNPATWRWGDAHRAVFAHPLLRFVPLLGTLFEARIETPGDETTIDRGGLASPGFIDVHGPAFRGAYDLGDLDASRFVVAPGQSGNPLSGHARDFVQRWRDGGTVPLTGDAGPDATHLRLTP